MATSRRCADWAVGFSITWVTVPQNGLRWAIRRPFLFGFIKSEWNPSCQVQAEQSSTKVRQLAEAPSAKSHSWTKASSRCACLAGELCKTFCEFCIVKCLPKDWLHGVAAALCTLGRNLLQPGRPNPHSIPPHAASLLFEGQHTWPAR